ncbi:hypothetical protein F5876DRAFT_40330 [Lentinula aff. lateritia]|uniref:Uncharacterized protein n=1 Tax=Lentinula aff. lateritia TaxID=2804960 RepID=A0ACC1U2U4_9AGAR|nr:hypothetical protein F5876DRAFT_40330 [Lentinula aff. lateritia]
MYRYFQWLVQEILVKHGGFDEFSDHLREPFGIQVLPSDKKDVQYPGMSIDADEGTYDGNAEVIENLLDQAAVATEDLKSYVELFHRDLATKERIEGLKRMWTIERTARNRLSFLQFVPGLFHMKMAVADAYARVHVAPVANCTVGVNKYLNYLRPKATAEFTSKKGPSFHSMHDTIHHVTWTDILASGAIEAQRLFKFDSLAAFEGSKPKWTQLVELSEAIINNHLPGVGFVKKRRSERRDLVFENMCLRNQHGLLYLGFSRAMNFGDVGCILQLFRLLIPTFTAVGKHKYAAHMTKFLMELDVVYPQELREAILRNWLFNSKGTPDGFRAFDWLQELNNLYTKVSFVHK